MAFDLETLMTFETLFRFAQVFDDFVSDFTLN